MKAINNTDIVVLFAVLVSLSACNPVLYSTVSQNVPLFKEKGEVAFNAGVAVSGSSNYFGSTGFNAQLAVAADSSLAIISSFYSIKDEESGKGNYFELGVGKFKHNPESKLTGEIFIGAGFGSIKNSFDGLQLNSNFLKVFIQPSGGYTTKIVDFALTPRIGIVNFTSYENEVNDQAVAHFFSEKKTTVVFEPGVTVRLGFKNIKLQYQLNYSTFKYDSSDFAVNDIFMSLNLFFLFPIDRKG